jgi:hypothetical protein
VGRCGENSLGVVIDNTDGGFSFRRMFLYNGVVPSRVLISKHKKGVSLSASNI